MQWPPHFALDLPSKGLLPADWLAQVQAATQAPERIVVQSGGEAMPDDEKFSILEGQPVRARLGWLWDLYLGPLRAFVSRSFAREVFPANRVSAAITLNILEGAGTEQPWHTDSNAVTGVLFATTMEDGGELSFRHPDYAAAALLPQAGTFVCFPGAISHRVAPLLLPAQRLSFAMIYYDSARDQPFANVDDRHEMSAA